MHEQKFTLISEDEFQRLSPAERVKYMEWLNAEVEQRIAETRRQIERQTPGDKPAQG